jgi:hypothetical protein
MADEMETDGTQKMETEVDDGTPEAEAEDDPTYFFQSTVTSVDPNFDQEEEDEDSTDEGCDEDVIPQDEPDSDDSMYDSDDSSFLSDASEEGTGGTFLDAIAGYTSKTPRQKFDEFLEKISSGKSKVFKITDECVLDYNLMASAAADVPVVGAGSPAAARLSVAEQAQLDRRLQLQQQEAEQQAQGAQIGGQRPPPPPPLHQELIAAVNASVGLTHAILGHAILKVLGPAGQAAVLTAVTKHDTLLFLKLGTDHSMQIQVLSTSAILQALTTHATPNLAEMEFRGLTLQTVDQVQGLVKVIGMRTQILRQLNILGIEFPVESRLGLNQGLLDPVFDALSKVEPLDELRLIGLGNPAPQTIVTSSALSNILMVKKKWWRLALDGMGMDDAHCYVIIDMFSRDATCKAGDLLSLYDNPAISADVVKSMAALFFLKRRMGAIKVDDPEWEAKFDLVRSMNNLHSRMDFIDNGALVDGNKWVEWLAKLNCLGWEDDKHKLNYMWFTLLEKPDLIYRRAGRDDNVVAEVGTGPPATK